VRIATTLRARDAEARARLAWEAMAASPPGCKRLKLRDRVRLSAAQLAARAPLTMRGEYTARDTFRRERAEGEPSYKARLWRLTSHLFTRQSEPVRKFPALHDPSTAEYVAAFDRLNHLKATQ
jgi:hypothetical protein